MDTGILDSPPAANCNATPGWVANSGDCDDSSIEVYAGVKSCFGASDVYTLQTCGGDGNWSQSNCPNGCTHAQCKSLDTIDISGQVSCGALQCTATQGCSYTGDDSGGPPPVCGVPTSNTYYTQCDGPSDCPTGQICCWHHGSGNSTSYMKCVADNGSCPYSNPGGWGEVVCSPGRPTCPGATTCGRADVYALFAAYICK
jgi:hypothetical protein